MPNSPIRILFICHGNICRSPMAEFILKHLVAQAGIAERFEIASAAVSTEEIGNDIYPPAKRKLMEKGIPFSRRAARQITSRDYDYYDYIICMDRSNLRWMQRLLPQSVGDDKKISLLMQWAGSSRDVADTWYTGDFETTYKDIVTACRSLITAIIPKITNN